MAPSTNTSMVAGRAFTRSVTCRVFALLLFASVYAQSYALAYSDERVAQNGEIATSAGPVSLGSAPERIALRQVDGRPLDLRTELPKLRSHKHMYLLLHAPHTDEQPGVLYHVYLDLPKLGHSGNNDLHYVGSLNFFEFQSVAQNNRYISFDITALAKRLSSKNRLTQPTTITFVPSGTPVKTSRPVIERIVLLIQ